MLLAWIPLSVHATNTTTTLHKALLSSIQGTPTVDPTVTTLQKEKLEHDTNWWWTNGVTLLTSLGSILALFVGGIVALIKWFGDRQAEREKQDQDQKRLLEDRQAEREKRGEEHFQSVVEGLGSTSQAAQVGAAITLRTFLRPGYEQFYRQAFDLAVAHLRLRKIDQKTAEPLDSLSQALVTIFKESFPLARQQLRDTQNMQQLDAAHVQLDNAYLVYADLQSVWIPEAYLRKANLSQANLKEANLSEANLKEASLYEASLKEANLSQANLYGANLRVADLYGANLRVANLSEAYLYEANLGGTKLGEANLSGAKLYKADLSGAMLYKADLSRADLSGANLSGANLSGANLSEANLYGADLSETILQNVLSWKGTKLLNVKGLTPNQLAEFQAHGAIAIIEEDKKKN